MSVRILAVHNYYYSRNPSGENVVFDAECDLLRRRGHHVDTHVRRSDEIRAQGAWGALKGAMATPWNPFEARKLREEAERLRPDVVHVHNTFPLISPSIFRAVGKRAARVLTLHNYRLVCPAAIPMRAGAVCTDCIDRTSALPSLVHGCYRSSRLATVPLASNVWLHRWLGTWRNEVDAFIALSDFQKELMTEAGIPEGKIQVKPNFIASLPVVLPYHQRDPYVVFVGRLSPEKGVRTLINAWRNWGRGAPELRLIGDGPSAQELRNAAIGLPIRFLGQMPPEETLNVIGRARLLILPSECFETFGLVVIEAFSNGTAAAVSAIGALPSIVRDGDTGVVFPAANSDALLRAVRSVWEQPGQLAEMGIRARRELELHYTEDSNYRTLMNVYDAALSESRRV